jgi:hypothetical protein
MLIKAEPLVNMGFKSHPTEIFVEIIVREGTGAKIEKRFIHNNSEDIKNLISWLRDKYGIDLLLQKPLDNSFLDLDNPFLKI